MKSDSGILLRILFLKSQNEPPCLKEAKELLEKGKEVEIKEAASIPEIISIVQSNWQGLVIIIVTQKEELMSSLHLLNNSLPLIKSKYIRVGIFSKIPSPRLSEVLRSKGCSEVFDFQLTAKAFLYKVKKHLKLIVTKKVESDSDTELSKNDQKGKKEGEEDEVKSNQNSIENYLKRDKKDSDQKIELKLNSKKVKKHEKSELSNEPVEVKIIDPLTIAWDYWLIQKKNDARRVLGRWLIEMIGPAPSEGHWEFVSIESPSGKAREAWEWKVKSKQSAFFIPDGRWIFFGRQPEFQWRTNRWRLVSDTPFLGLYEKDKEPIFRFQAKTSLVFELRKNSESAQAKLPWIQKSFDQTYEFSKDKPKEAKEMLYVNEEEEKKKSGKDLKVRKEDLSKIDWNNLEKDDEDGKSNEWNEGDLSPDEEAKDRKEGDLSADEKAADWNEGDLSPDEEPEDWNDRGGRRQTQFNSGRGITQGQNSDHVTYEKPDFLTGVDAFKPVRIRTLLKNKPVELIEFDDQKVMLDIPDQLVKQEEQITVQVVTENMVPAQDIEIYGKVVSVLPSETAGRVTVDVLMVPESGPQFRLVQKALEVRQNEALAFMKKVKGF